MLYYFGSASHPPDTAALMEYEAHVRSPAQLDQRLRQMKSQGKRIVFTNGCFDLLHRGHVHLLREAAAQGDVLVVGLNSDQSVSRLKGNDRPVFSQAERAEVLSALEMVDLVCVFEEDTPLQTIEMLRPDVLVKGADWKGEIVGQDAVEGWGGRVVVVPIVEGQSTSRMLDGVRARLGRSDADT